MPVASNLPAMRSDYNEHSNGQRRVLDVALTYIKKGIEAHNATLPTSGPLIIADFGSSTGANSSAAMSLIVENFREKYGFEQTPSILAIHEDLPANCWNVFFNYMEENDEAYVKKHKGVFPLAAGRSFVKQILPNNCLHFGFSNAALHWLSSVPVKIENHCLPWRGTKKERDLWEKQAAEDWQSFLTARSAELVSGGVLVVYVMPEDITAIDCIYDSLYAAVLRLRDQGIVTSDEVLDFNLRMYLRTVQDVSKPELLERLGLELVVVEKAQPVAYATYEGYCQHRSVTKWAADVATSMLAAFEPSFLTALSPSRNGEQKNEICSHLARIFAEEVAKLNPDSFGSVTGIMFVVLKKK